MSAPPKMRAAMYSATRTLVTLSAAILAGCGSAPARTCPLPTAAEERAAFFERLEERRAHATPADVPTLDTDAARLLAEPSTFLRVRITERGVGLREGHDITSWSREQLEAQLELSDPMLLGLLLSRDDVDGLVPLDANGHVAASARPGGAEAFLIPALANAIVERIRLGGLPPEIGLEIRPATPFRTVAEVVYTAGQAGVDRFELVVRAGETEGAHPIAMPRFDSVDSVEALLEGGQTPSLGLTLTLTHRGAVVAGFDDPLAPGCETRATASDGLTLPSATAAVDADALRACLRRVKHEYPDEDTIIVSADPEVPFEHVARAAVAAAGTEGELFPITVLSAGVR